jgi:hypothetical protein
MSKVNKSTNATTIAAQLPDNTTGFVTPARARLVTNNLNESAVNILDGTTHTELDTTDTTITLDMNSEADKSFVGSDLIGADTDVVFSNVTNLRTVKFFSFQITAGFKLNFLTGIGYKAFDGNWTGALEWTAPATAYYLMTVRYDGTTKFIDIEGNYTTA